MDQRTVQTLDSRGAVAGLNGAIVVQFMSPVQCTAYTLYITIYKLFPTCFKITISDPDSDVPANTIYLYATGDDILRPFSYTSEHYWRNVGCLIALAVGFRFIGYLVLAFKFRKANR